MKATLRATTFGVYLLLGFYPSLFRVYADTVYLSTANANTILKFDSVGNQSTFATASSGLSDPLGLAVDSSGNLYVANGLSGTIEEFTPSGTGTVFASAASGLSGPFGLAFDSSGDLYVANSGNNTIEEFNSSGTGSVFATAAWA